MRDEVPIVIIPDLTALGSLIELRHLRIQSTAKDLSFVSELRHLERLDLSLCEHVKTIGPMRGLTKLKELDLSNCDRLKDLGELESLLPQLEKLSLWRVPDPRAEELERAFRKQRRGRAK